jgi:hypothetical protein
MIDSDGDPTAEHLHLSYFLKIAHSARPWMTMRLNEVVHPYSVLHQCLSALTIENVKATYFRT